MTKLKRGNEVHSDFRFNLAEVFGGSAEDVVVLKSSVVDKDVRGLMSILYLGN